MGCRRTQYPAAFQVFGVAVERQSKKHRTEVSYGSVNPATREVLKTFPEHADEQRWNASATADQAFSHNAKEAFSSLV